MSLTKSQQMEIESVIRRVLADKMSRYKPESVEMPFHARLLGKDRLALYSFIHSLSTSFGVSIFEPVAKIIAEKNFSEVKLQFEAGKEIAAGADAAITGIMNRLESAQSKPDHAAEFEAVRKARDDGAAQTVRLRKADVFLRDKNGAVCLIDLKTAKPNISGFADHKRMLLRWTAAFLRQEPQAKVRTMIAIPYNPYAPNPYRRWTMRGMLDMQNQLLVGAEFWDFLAGKAVYESLLDCFERVGCAMREEIDDYFSRFRAAQTAAKSETQKWIPCPKCGGVDFRTTSECTEIVRLVWSGGEVAQDVIESKNREGGDDVLCEKCGTLFSMEELAPETDDGA